MGILLIALGLLVGTAYSLEYTEPFRPQYHFSPSKNWMNDPSGLLYYNETYHLFFQYNPGGIEWGNMSWGHATSKDLAHWEERPIALLARGYPDNVTEMYFTGSAVADVNNTSGFGVEGKIPLVAMYTSSVGLYHSSLYHSWVLTTSFFHEVSSFPKPTKREICSRGAAIPVNRIQP